MRYRNRFWLPAMGIVAMVGVGLLAPLVAAQGEAPGVQAKEVVLDNGLNLLLVERHEQPTVAAGLFYDVGSVNDPRGKSGIAHLFEHMLFKGTKVIGTTDFEAEQEILRKQDKLRAKMIAEMNRMREMKRRGQIRDVLDPEQWTAEYKRLKKEYDDLIEQARRYIKNNEVANLYTSNGGARLNAGTAEDVTMYFVELPSSKLELFFWVESDRMANGVMREFYVERDNVREERRLRVESTPTGKHNEAFESMFWQAHPYGIPVLGWPSEVESITRDDVRAFYRIYYAPNNATLVLVGDFNTDRAVSMAKKYFGRIPRGETEPPPVITEEVTPTAIRRFYAEAETNPRVRVRWHTVAIGHPDEAALDVLGGLLSGKSGRLYRRLVDHEEVAIGMPSAFNQSRKYAGYFEINVTLKEGASPGRVERLILEELSRIQAGNIGAREFQKVKNQVLASTVQRLRTNFGLMFQLGLYETWYKWEYINEAPQRMLDVTMTEVQEVANRYLDRDTRTVAVYLTKGSRLATEVPLDEKPSGPDRAATSSQPAGAAAEVALHPDPEVAAVMARLQPKWREHLLNYLEVIETLDDENDIDVRAGVLETGLASRDFEPEVQDMWSLIIRRLRERQFAIRAEKRAAEEAGNGNQGGSQE